MHIHTYVCKYLESMRLIQTVAICDVWANHNDGDVKWVVGGPTQTNTKRKGTVNKKEKQTWNFIMHEIGHYLEPWQVISNCINAGPLGSLITTRQTISWCLLLFLNLRRFTTSIYIWQLKMSNVTRCWCGIYRICYCCCQLANAAAVVLWLFNFFILFFMLLININCS